MVELIDKSQQIAPDPGMTAGRQLCRFLSRQLDRSLKPALEQTDRLQQRGLSRTRGPEQRNDFIRIDVQIDAAQHLDHNIPLHKASLHAAIIGSLIAKHLDRIGTGGLVGRIKGRKKTEQQRQPGDADHLHRIGARRQFCQEAY